MGSAEVDMIFVNVTGTLSSNMHVICKHLQILLLSKEK